jgi:hypothetical protein
MRKVYIYFNGEIIQTIKCDRASTEYSKDMIALTVSVGENTSKIVALIPFNHLIVFIDND